MTRAFESKPVLFVLYALGLFLGVVLPLWKRWYVYQMEFLSGFIDYIWDAAPIIAGLFVIDYVWNRLHTKP